MREGQYSSDLSFHDELRDLRLRRDELRSERIRIQKAAEEAVAKVEHELAIRDAMIASITSRNPELVDANDSGAPRRRVELGPTLLAVLVDARGSALSIGEVHTATMRRLSTEVTASQVRDGLRYLAKHDDQVAAEHDHQRHVSYRFRMTSPGEGPSPEIRHDNATNHG